MKRVIGVSAREFATKWPSRNYISDYHKFNIECKVLNENIGFFKDKYTLQLEGTAENIQLFIDYLRCEGFKII